MAVDDMHASPDAYDRHVGRYGPALADALIELAGVRHGQRVLDVGCGPGALARALAAVVGESGVAAVDPSAPFVEACRARVPGADVQVAAAEALPFADDSFDAVLAQLVVNFMRDAPAGVGEMRRVARGAAAVGAVVWDYAGGMTLLRTFWDAALEVDPDDAPLLDEGARMPYCSPEELGGLWAGVGLADVVTGEVVVSARYEDFDDLWRPFAAGVGPSGAYCASLVPAQRERLRAAFFERLGAPAGPFELTARAWSVLGRA